MQGFFFKDIPVQKLVNLVSNNLWIEQFHMTLKNGGYLPLVETKNIPLKISLIWKEACLIDLSEC